jgi:hypothetical protein
MTMLRTLTATAALLVAQTASAQTAPPEAAAPIATAAQANEALNPSYS